jgi:pimeloyl-[acyl-carrier protein] methyl ester esterase
MVTLVLLPGLDGTGLLFSDFISALGPEFEAIVARYPTERGLSYAELESLVRALLPTDRPFVLLGESFSGPIAVSISASRPRGLVGLILCCSFARYPRRLLAKLRALVPVIPVKGRFVSLVGRIANRRGVSPALRSRLREVAAKVSSSVLRARIGEVLRADVRNKLSEIEVPILYLRASYDGVIPPRASEEIRRLVPRVRVVEFDAPHFLLQAVARRAAEVIGEFAREVGGSYKGRDTLEPQIRNPGVSGSGEINTDGRKCKT